MESLKDLAVRAAKKAGRVLQRRLGRTRRIDYKGAVNLVTEMDIRSERIIVSEIRKRFPEHGFLAEEKARQQSGSPYRWIIDPLDGTTNYAHGFPVYSISIGLEYGGEIILGVVYDPSREELFVAQKGKGARLNGRRMAVSGKTSEFFVGSVLPSAYRESLR